ncbi:hypothetical protein EON81_28205 [bacterium]|nr:MAG: hypothetical protein EON81_28205 [bacterium]
MLDNEVLQWLFEGDPAIRWQAMRDLQDRPEGEWAPVRALIPEEGWGARLVAAMTPEGSWPEVDWCRPVWTLTTLIDLGFPAGHPAVSRAAHAYLAPRLNDPRIWDEVVLFKRTSLFRDVDLCHVGFDLRIGAYFGGDPAALKRLGEILLDLQMPDGGWNCRSQRLPKTRHSSFHTTFNVLEGLSLAAKMGILGAKTFREVEERAMEFVLQHVLYRSDRTGEIIKESFTRLTYPWYYHYTILRGLDYLRRTPEIFDPRLADPMAWLESRRGPEGRWPVEKPISGKVPFAMERMNGDSRWNTLRALRVMKGRQSVM